VLAALTALQKKGMVHKRGKAWYAGGAHIARGRIRITTWRRVILVIQDREDRWQWLARLARTGNFCRQCIAEAEQHGVSMISAIAGGSGGASGRFAARIARVKSLIADLRSRYLGTLIVSSVRELPDIAAWVEALTALRRPVVWFDRYGERAPALPDSRYFTRCRFSEEAGCVLAIRALADAGHRECVFPVSAPGWMRWQFHRRDLLSQQAKQASVRMHAFEHMVNDISINSEHGEEAALEAYQPLFRRIPTYRNATALIAPNDYTAALYYRWLSDSGAQIPRQLSLLSFDNDIAVSLLPITTIDFGLGYLGYAAFHTILGAMPIKRDAGVVSSSPRLVDRGSVGAPRRGPLWTPAAAFHGRRRAAGQSQ
jgi:DNA-binding LacI/PurR family transcriptional regulator